MKDIFPPFTEDYRFTGPSTAISCTVDYDAEEGLYIATSSAGFKGMADTAERAALACFNAWVGVIHGWYESPSRDE